MFIDKVLVENGLRRFPCFEQLSHELLMIFLDICKCKKMEVFEPNWGISIKAITFNIMILHNTKNEQQKQSQRCIQTSKVILVYVLSF